MQPYSSSIDTVGGSALRNASVAVKLNGVLATIYDLDGVEQANPMTTDSTGSFSFRAANGEYTLEITRVGIVPRTETVLLYDPADDVSSTDNLASDDDGKGAGLVGFLYSAVYAAGTLGKWLQDLATSEGAALIGFIQSGTDAEARTVQDKLRDVVSIKDFGAVCDGVEDDTAAIQAALDAISDGQELVFVGTPLTSDTLYLSAKNNVTLNFDGCELKVSHSSGCSLFVHGGSLSRDTLTWQDEIIEDAYESVTPCKGVRVRGFKASSTDGSQKATQVFAYFADDCHIDGRVRNSNGLGLTFRQCVRPSFDYFEVEDFNTYGLFVYQCHGLKGGLLKARDGGRGLVIKQRHKFYDAVDHHIDRVILTDLEGFSDGLWASGGGGFNELARAGESAEAVANRNFTGHEIVRNVTIDRMDMVVTSTASAAVSAPSLYIECYADNWKVREINFDAGGKSATYIPLAIGSAGDISAGKAGGATFGQNHEITNVNFSNFNISNSNPLIQYGVSCSIVGGTYKNCTARRIITQLEPASATPFGSVESIEFRKHIGDITMPMGGIAEQGVRIQAETKRFVSGGNRLKVTPLNSATESLCNPWYVKAPMWQTIGRDEIEVVSGGAGASNHTTTYGAYTIATSGNINMKITATAPATVTGLGVASAASTKALVLEPCELVLTDAPTGGKIGISTSGEVTNMGGHTYTGAWGTTHSDSSGKNSQNLRRVVYLTAAPTTGAWATGDRVINIAPAVGSPKGWACTASGTPGTWVSEGNL